MIPTRKEREERFRNLFLKLIALGFMIVGINSIIRTYCLNLPGGGHLVHTCDVLTAPITYVVGFITFMIGFVIFNLDRFLKWFAK
jgi:hypothetical protein